MRFAFRSFRSRLLVFVLGLVVGVQGAVLIATNRANVAEARRLVDEALERTARAFGRNLAVRTGILTEKARLLSSDFAFKQAVATGEAETVRSALENHRDRVGADVMMLVSMDGTLSVDTLHPGAHDGPCPLAGPLGVAEDSDTGEADAIELVDGLHYQLVVVPLFTPEPTAWILIGFEIDDDLATDLRRETGTHVSLLPWRRGAEPFASTLHRTQRSQLASDLPWDEDPDRSLVVALDGEEHVTWVVPVPTASPREGEDAAARERTDAAARERTDAAAQERTDAAAQERAGAAPIVAVLQRSLREAMSPYLALRDLLLGILGVGVGLSALGGLLLASRVTRPVNALAAGAGRIADGDYETPVRVTQQDELGVLADSFNHMMKGLSERDRVRDLLGKVVSPEVAEELLSRGIELGGEQREVSVLFSDIRRFTTISERKTPHELVHFLNDYLTRVSAVVERNGGVVDKYIGDAVMAIFGAPIAGDDDATRAVRTAVEMAAAVRDMEEAPAIGVGVNTGAVVAGNMGSSTRLNYTVIGDAVNLASRLEGLTKRYGVPVIVSEATRDACPGWAFRELDRVRVKGKEEPVRIFEPVAPADALRPEQAERIARHEEALALYRAGRLEEALRGFEAMLSDDDPVLLALYHDRIVHLSAEGLPDGWDGTTDFDEK